MKKRVLTALLSLIMLSGIPVHATYPSEVDYMHLMMTSAEEGDWDTGQYAQFARNTKIDEEILPYNKVSYEDLFILAKVICAEAGSQWLSDEWKMSVGEVVLNRVQSQEFPNTVAEVVYQPGQYYGAGSQYFDLLIPDKHSISLARQLLEGERVLENPAVVFQANFRQGSGVHTAYFDDALGWTYFCYSSSADLYET